MGQLRPVAPGLQHVAAQDQQQPESPAKPLLHHSEFVAPQVSNGHFAGQSAPRTVDMVTLSRDLCLLHHILKRTHDASPEHDILHLNVWQVSLQGC